MRSAKLFLTSLLLLAVTAVFVFTPVYAVQDGNDNTTETEAETVTVTFNPNGGELRRGELVQVIPVGGNAAPPMLMLRFDGWIFDSWDKETTDITEDTEITALWKRLFAVSSNGEGHVSSLEVVWLARAAAGHVNFGLQDLRLGNVLGIDRLPTARDIVDLLRWLVGYSLEELMKNSPDNMPTIEVLTEFPDGETQVGNVTFEYFAEPSIGAEIALVKYTINDGEYFSTIWANGDALDELGTGRIPLMKGDNHIVLTVLDTEGKSADYVVPQVPHKIDLNFSAPSQYFSQITDEVGHRYAGDRLIFSTVWLDGADLITAGITPERVAEAVATIDGVIIGQSTITGSYTVQVPAQETVEDLEALGERMLSEYPDLFRVFYTDRLDEIYSLGMEVPPFNPTLTNDPWWTEREEDPTSRWPFRRYIDYEWGHRAVNLPEAWAISRFAQSPQRNNIKVGIMDTNVFTIHEDLPNIPLENISSPADTFLNMSHGTNVMGAIAAVHNNNKGLAGATNISGESLYVANLSRYVDDGNGGMEFRHSTRDSMVESLEWLVLNGVKVVNVSMFSSQRNAPYDNVSIALSDRMALLLSLGYDFVVVQITGQQGTDDTTPPLNANHTVAFSHAHLPVVARMGLERRTITVGASNRKGSVAPWSGYGTVVDINAPGQDIYTTVSMSNAKYGNYDILSGTSIAAPLVTGILQIMWEENPEIKGDTIKSLLLGNPAAGWFVGDRLTDNRGKDWSTSGSIYQVNALQALQRAQHATGLLVHRDASLVGQLLVAHEHDSLIPLANAQITRYIYGNPTAQTTTHTQSQGFYRFDNIEVNDTDSRQNWHTLRVQAEGFAPTDITTLIIQKGVSTRLDTLRLVPIPQEPNRFSMFGGRIRVPALVGASDEPAELTPYEGTLTLQIIDGLYYLDPEMLEDEEWLDFLDFDILDTIEVTDGNFYAEMPAGNYTVIVSGEGIYTEAAHVISHWDEDEPYWLNQDIVVRERVFNDITEEFPPHVRERVFAHLYGLPYDRIYEHEVAKLKYVHFCHLGIQDMQELSALKYFTAMTVLCVDGNHLTELELSNYPNLITVVAQNVPLVKVDVTQNINLRDLILPWTYTLTSIDVSNNVNLEYLVLVYSNLTSLDVSNNKNLSRLYVWNNFMQSRDDVIGWQNTRLAESGGYFDFDPQRVRGQSESHSESESQAHATDFTPDFPHDLRPHNCPTPIPTP
ncbi:MAG: S8 family serine peptidase [Defluviitaleaceae bacterium]|nr:S8 family serine peptidase [Defluviitaleaceae bacterium]